MKIAEPIWSYAYLGLMILIIFCIWALKKRNKRLENFAQSSLLPALTLSADTVKQRLKTIFIVAACSLCIFSLSRPQWGSHWQEVKRKGIDILIALDVSKSMLAEDIKPSRLERAKLAIKDFARNLKGDRIGLIAFAGESFLQSPLTSDYNGFLLTLDNLDTNTIERPGTNISGAIIEAKRAYEAAISPDKILIIITDGEDNEGDALKTAEDAKKDGITIHTIGIGSQEGELIPETAKTLEKTFLKNREGLVVKTQLNESLLQKIALSANGAYIHAISTDFGLEKLYKLKLAQIEKRELESKALKIHEDRYQIFLLIALILLIAELFIPERRVL